MKGLNIVLWITIYALRKWNATRKSKLRKLWSLISVVLEGCLEALLILQIHLRSNNLNKKWY